MIIQAVQRIIATPIKDGVLIDGRVRVVFDVRHKRVGIVTHLLFLLVSQRR
jgi:hypothetical protein